MDFILPIQRNDAIEDKAREIFREMHDKDAGEDDAMSVMRIAYGLRPQRRDLDLEILGIADFVSLFGRLPADTLDWNILRTIVYK